MDLNTLESEETGVKTLMTRTKKPEDKTTQSKNSTPKKKQQTPKPVPNITLRDDQCRYSKDTGQKASSCPNMAKQGKMEEDTNAARCTHCNAPGHKDPKCYFETKMDNCPPKWTIIEAQKKTHWNL